MWKKRQTLLAMFVGTLILAFGAAQGAIVVTPYTTAVTRVGFESDVLNNDLANNNQATFLSASDTTVNGGGPLSSINDGTSGPNNDSGFRGYQSGNFLRINLNTTLNPLGYNITGITSFAGHDDWRASQNYNVSLALVGAPSTFLPLTSAAVSSTGGSTKLMLTNQGGGVLNNGTLSASGVSSIRFDFQEADFGVYREFDVIGAVGPQLVQPGGAGAIGVQTIANAQQNIAPGKTASQSTDYNNDPGLFPASRAIDGDYGNFSHTDSNDSAPWWQVNLGAMREIDNIQIYNRDNGWDSRLVGNGGFRVEVLEGDGATVAWAHNYVGAAFSSPFPINLSGLGIDGQIVKLSKLDPLGGGDDRTFNLAEVEVFATIPGDFTLFTGGTLEIELAPDLATADKLSLTGKLTIDPNATLNVLLLSGSPAPGQRFDILDFNSVVGTFTTVNLPGGAGLWDISNLYTTGEITFGADIPEPATMALLGLAVTGLGGYIRRRRTA